MTTYLDAPSFNSRSLPSNTRTSEKKFLKKIITNYINNREQLVCMFVGMYVQCMLVCLANAGMM